MTRGWGKTRHCFFEPFQMSTINDMVLRWGSAGAVGGPRPSGPISAPPPDAILLAIGTAPTMLWRSKGRSKACSTAVHRNGGGVAGWGGGPAASPATPGGPHPDLQGGGVRGGARGGCPTPVLRPCRQGPQRSVVAVLVSFLFPEATCPKSRNHAKPVAKEDLARRIEPLKK